ncbi:MAG TPA: hypothetical protein VMU55_08980 [Solirubrobacteraceae bacterium]|nr:hypothetical protein [Solirubrobacteraceae bacterium]
MSGKMQRLQARGFQLESGLASAPDIDALMRFVHGCDFELILAAGPRDNTTVLAALAFTTVL